MADRSYSTHPDQDREFELVLGNKQLFSLLFIVFVLLGVFFAMGYVMGRNTGSAPDLTGGTPSSSDATSVRTSKPTAAEGTTAPAPATSAANKHTPAAPTQAEPAASTEAAPPAEAAKPAPAPAEPPAPGGVIDPKPGQIFLQVSAMARPEAEILADVLAKRGFAAAIAPGPNDKVFRVLVGPAKTDAELGRMKTDLEQAGFKTMVRRY